MLHIFGHMARGYRHGHARLTLPVESSSSVELTLFTYNGGVDPVARVDFRCIHVSMAYEAGYLP